MTTLPPPGQPRPGVDISPPIALHRCLVQRMLDAMGHPPRVFVLWNGDEIRGSEAERYGRRLDHWLVPHRAPLPGWLSE